MLKMAFRQSYINFVTLLKYFSLSSENSPKLSVDGSNGFVCSINYLRKTFATTSCFIVSRVELRDVDKLNVHSSLSSEGNHGRFPHVMLQSHERPRVG